MGGDTMVKVKSSVEDLQRDLTRLQGLKGGIEGRIRGLQEGLDLAAGRDAELARAGFAGKDVVKERARMREQTAAKQAERERETRDLGLLVEELQRLARELDVAQHQADLARAEASTRRRQAGIGVAAREIREALAGPASRLEELWAEYQEERQLRNRLNGSFECPGEQILERLGYLVAELLHGAQAIERGTP